MKILIYSPLFYPSVGGLETVVMTLASQLHIKGHDVRVVTKISDSGKLKLPFLVYRNPAISELLNYAIWSDVYFQPTISLKGLWPVLVLSKPWVVSHNNWYTRENGKIGWQDLIKKFVIRYATNISVSRAIADHILVPSKIIPNPYRDDIFYQRPNISRNKEIVFLGRLVSDKGVDILIECVAKLKKKNLKPCLTIVGSGPEEKKLRNQTKHLGIGNQVNFIGIKTGDELAHILNEHQVMVVPSRWNEPFGIVAVEGIACGCVVVGSDGGGLKDAIGLCGITFPNGDDKKLTEIICELLTKPNLLQSYRSHFNNHLEKHRPSYIADRYLEVFQQTVN